MTPLQLTLGLTSHRLKPWQAYVFSVVVTALTVVARLGIDDQLGGHPTLVMLTVPIMVSAYAGGIGPGLLATVLSYVAATYFLLPPLHTWTVESTAEKWDQFFVALAGVVITLLNEAVRRAQHRLELAAQEQQGTERALLESQSRYRALVEWSPEAIALHRNGQLIFVNPAAARMFGATSPTEMIGRPVVSLIHPDSRATALERMKRSSEDRSITAPLMEMKVLRLDGTAFDVEVQGIALDYDGEPALLSSLHDVSQRKAHEVEIERLNRLYSALSHINQAIVRMPAREDLFGEVCRIMIEFGGVRMAWIGWHEAGSTLLTPIATCGDDYGDVRRVVVNADDRPESRPPSARAFLEERAIVTNDMAHDPNTEPWREIILRAGYYSGAAFPIRFGGNVCGVLSVFSSDAGYFQDKEIALLLEVAHDISFALDNLQREKEREQFITEARAASIALQSAEERTRFALESAKVGIWDMDYTTGVLQWSNIMQEQYGFKEGTFNNTFDAFVGRVHSDDRDRLLSTIQHATKFGEDFTTLHRAVRPDGTMRMLSGAGRIVLNEHGEASRGVGISLDITERRTLEEQFQQAQKMEAIGRLAGGVAHDFNNLLTVMLGFCELLLSDPHQSDAHRADVEEIQKAGTSAAALTRQLLAFSRKQIIEPTLVIISAVVADMRAMMERLIGEDVKVVLKLGENMPAIMTDRTQLEQVIMNLVVNARDAMPHGGTLTIETASVELDEHYAQTHFSVAPGSYVVLTVSDTGSGMTDDTQARLFEPFFTTKEIGKGTGLGLATVHGIVTSNGGTVNVYSEIGVGTSFKVYFPKSSGSVDAVESAPAARRVSGGVQTILLVEDAEGLRDLTRRLLEQQNFIVLVAANAAEAKAVFIANASIDLLLTDVVMPGKSGPELSKELQAIRPSLRVVYMSGYTDEAIVQHGVLNPGIALLSKPFTSEALRRKIRETLES